MPYLCQSYGRIMADLCHINSIDIASVWQTYAISLADFWHKYSRNMAFIFVKRYFYEFNML